MQINVAQLSMLDFDGDIDEVISRLQGLKNEHPDKKLKIDAYEEQLRYCDFGPTVFQVYYDE